MFAKQLIEIATSNQELAYAGVWMGANWVCCDVKSLE